MRLLYLHKADPCVHQGCPLSAEQSKTFSHAEVFRILTHTERPFVAKHRGRKRYLHYACAVPLQGVPAFSNENY